MQGFYLWPENIWATEKAHFAQRKRWLPWQLMSWQWERVDREEEKRVFPGQMFEKQRKPQCLIRINRLQIKDHHLVRFNNPNFLIHRFAFDHTVLYFYNRGSETGKDGAGYDLIFHACWWWTRSSCGVGSLSFPPVGSQACCLLLKPRLRQQVAPVICPDNNIIWTIALKVGSLFDWYTTFLKSRAQIKHSPEELVLMSAVQGLAIWLKLMAWYW